MDPSDLIRKRGSIKGLLTRFQNQVESIKKIPNPDELSLSQLKIRLESVRPLLNEFNTIQFDIESVLTKDDEIKANEKERENFENSYFSILALAQTILDKNNNFAASSHSLPRANSNSSLDPSAFVNQVKLPTITLPTFEGNYENWLEFRDTFNSLIHDKKGISNIEKFHYLKASLKDEAGQIIQSLQLCDANYLVAWKALLDRYNNKRLILSNHIRALFNLPTLSKESHILLRQLLDGVSKHLRSLKILDQPVDQWDALLIHLIVSKLDMTTKREWESYKINGEFPTISELTEFLKSRCELLETLNLSQSNEVKSNNNKHKFIKYQTHMASNNLVATNDSNANKQPICVICKNSHIIYNCDEFKAMPVQSRIAQAKSRKLCFNCLRNSHSTNYCKSPGCRFCRRKHHSLLHINSNPSSKNSPMEVPQQSAPATNNAATNNDATTSETNIQIPSTNSNHVLNDYNQQVLLSTAIIRIVSNSGSYYNCRALLDSGSQSNFITEDVCNVLGLQKTKMNLAITGIGQISTQMSHVTEVAIKSRFNNYEASLSCIIVPKITGNLPNYSFNASSLEIPENIQLADETFNISNKVDLLIGAQVFWNLMCVGQVKLGVSQLTLQKTRFGWVLAGPLSYQVDNFNNSRCNLSTTSSHIEAQNQLAKFWELEECQSTKSLSREENYCEEHFLNTTSRGKNGRFYVSIPLKEPVEILGDSKELAINRFNSLERKLLKNPQLRELYVGFMEEYELLGHMEKIEAPDKPAISYYLPHHGVFKQDSITTKLRVVFDGSAKSSTGVSINDLQMIGPTVQDDLFSILIRFRKHQYALSADVAKMYRQVFIHPEQRNLQRIVWRTDPSKPLSHYNLNTVTYGTSAASFLAIRALRQLAYDNINQYPQAAEIILRDFYVDDLLSGADSIEEALTIQKQIIQILQQGCFELRKWISNDKRLLQGLPNSSNLNIIKLCPDDSTKTLGLLWLPKLDTLGFCIKLDEPRSPVTKRHILSTASKIFDPLGLVAPATIISKILLQKLWQCNLTWDESVPMNLHTEWLRFQDEFTALQEIKVPRKVIIPEPTLIEIHGFSDASEAAYGACVYIRSINASGYSMVQLVSAKSKVAPLKYTTIPRLELCAALLLARLIQRVRTALALNINSVNCWCDSSIALAWIKTAPNLLKTFVANRVAEIQDLTVQYEWRHVASKENPADLLSRGVSPLNLIKAKLWWHGPVWLLQFSPQIAPENYYKDFENSPDYLTERRRQVTALTIKTEPHALFGKFSSLSKLQRVVAYCLRFKNNSINPKNQRIVGNLTVQELSDALRLLIKIAQQDEFKQEISDLRKHNQIQIKSNLLTLNPFIDLNGILRVGGRLANSHFSENKKHPILLPKGHKLTLLIIKHMHEITLHSGPQALLAYLRETYWPVSGRNLVKKIVHSCVRCFRANPRPAETLMGPLPEDRLKPHFPFEICGVDYCGPILIKNKKGRGCKSEKAYICIFICFATKAIHTELVSELTTEAFLASLRRFSSRRGKPSKIYSDNGSNFVGANTCLKKFLSDLNSNAKNNNFQNSLTSEGIIWNFIPPRSPHFGGLWEAGVKTIKFHLKRVLGTVLFTYEELSTVLTQIEAIANSRPLSPLSADPSDLNPLTPAHFLIGRSLVSVPDQDVTEVKDGRLSQFQKIQKIMQQFWKRWSKEYVSELQTRVKWKRSSSALIQPGAMVVIREDNVPPLKWRLGRVLEQHPGPDGEVRVVSIKCASGVKKRAISKVCVLPVETH